jgi:hypothetical protein
VRLVPTVAKGILLAAPRTGDAATLGRALDQLAELCRRRDLEATRLMLRRLVPEYRSAAEPGSAAQPMTPTAG